MDVLAFQVKSDFARFRCPYSTTSAATFLCIHPIAAKGLIGSILGIDYSKLYEKTHEFKIGIEVLSKINKDTQSFNMIAMSNNNGSFNFQSRIQFLRDVKYNIYVHGEKELLDELEELIKSNISRFTPYLGCSEHIAKVRHILRTDAKKTDEEHVNSIIPKENLIFNPEKNLYFDKIPVSNLPTREYNQYCDIVFSNENQLETKELDIYKVGDKNVFFF